MWRITIACMQINMLYSPNCPKQIIAMLPWDILVAVADVGVLGCYARCYIAKSGTNQRPKLSNNSHKNFELMT